MADTLDWITALEIGALLGMVAGYGLSRFGYWLGRMHEYDYCKSQGWLSPIRVDFPNVKELFVNGKGELTQLNAETRRP